MPNSNGLIVATMCSLRWYLAVPFIVTCQGMQHEFCKIMHSQVSYFQESYNNIQPTGIHFPSQWQPACLQHDTYYQFTTVKNTWASQSCSIASKHNLLTKNFWDSNKRPSECWLDALTTTPLDSWQKSSTQNRIVEYTWVPSSRRRKEAPLSYSTL